jgi:hypothetical protein
MNAPLFRARDSQEMPPQECTVNPAPRPGFFRHVPGYQPGAAKPIKAFRAEAGLAIQHAAHDVCQFGIIHQQYQDPSQVIAVKRLIPGRLLLKRVEPDFLSCQFIQPAPHQVRMAPN